MGNDIALIKLMEPLKLDGHFQKKIPYNNKKYLEENKRGYAIGRERRNKKMQSNSSEILSQENNKSRNSLLKLIPIHIISNELCRQRKFYHITKNQLCAVAYDSPGPCDGDSGGSLVNRNLTILWGLLSYGRSVCKPYRIYVFTRISPYIEWISETIKNAGS
ncbi:transmembrane protease serine 3-like isoform X2 [Haematobia irritans]|uniref:transmembrane protease serine 3-like isoform X2 n=1 Tax=Haematobia irritans TaxID=7368 RepID=UPI003F4F9A84